MRALKHLSDIVDVQVDGRSLAVTRIVIGIAGLLQMIDTASILSAVLDDTKMQIPYVSWLPVISTGWLPAYLLLWCVAAVLFAIGWRTALAGSILCPVLAYSLVIDQQSYSNHVFLLTLVVALLTLGNSGNRFSVDAWRGRTRATVSGWPGRLLQYQVSIVYFFAAVSKLNVVYISGSVLAANMADGWVVPLPDAWQRWELMMPLAVVSILTEVFLALGFWSPRYRYPAIVIGIAMHTVIALTFPIAVSLQLLVFGLIMAALYVQFIDLDAVLARIARLRHAPLESPTTAG